MCVCVCVYACVCACACVCVCVCVCVCGVCVAVVWCVHVLQFSPKILQKKTSLKEKLFSRKKKKKAESESEDDDDSSDDECTQAPRMYLLFPKSVQFKYQFNAYIYQARDLHGSDESGLSGE